MTKQSLFETILQENDDDLLSQPLEPIILSSPYHTEHEVLFERILNEGDIKIRPVSPTPSPNNNPKKLPNHDNQNEKREPEEHKEKKPFKEHGKGEHFDDYA